MFVELLVGQRGWFSRKCKLTWKRKGTKYGRSYFQLVVSTLPTEGIGFGLLPTATANAWKGARELNENGENISQSGQKYGVRIEQLAKAGLLPTPNTMDTLPPKDGDVNPKSWEAYGMLPTPRVKGHGNSHQRVKQGKIDDLTTMAKNGLLPTPAMSNYKGASSTEALEKRGRLKDKADNLADQFAQPGKSSQLNPQFVLEMMGFPEDWTLLPFLNGETNQSKPQETP
jgi:hypothetical protein